MGTVGGWVGLNESIMPENQTPLFRSSALFKMLQSFHTCIDVSAFTRDLNGVFYFFFTLKESNW